MDFKQFINEFTELAQSTIIELEGDKLTGEQKKAKLDTIILTWATSALEQLKINFFIKLGLKWCITNYLPVLTQKIFDLIQVRVSGITKSKAV